MEVTLNQKINLLSKVHPSWSILHSVGVFLTLRQWCWEQGSCYITYEDLLKIFDSEPDPSQCVVSLVHVEMLVNCIAKHQAKLYLFPYARYQRPSAKKMTLEDQDAGRIVLHHMFQTTQIPSGYVDTCRFWYDLYRNHYGVGYPFEENNVMSGHLASIVSLIKERNPADWRKTVQSVLMEYIEDKSEAALSHHHSLAYLLAKMVQRKSS